MEDTDDFDILVISTFFDRHGYSNRTLATRCQQLTGLHAFISPIVHTSLSPARAFPFSARMVRVSHEPTRRVFEGGATSGPFSLLQCNSHATSVLAWMDT